MSRAERLQLIVSLMRSSPGIHPADLAARCRVSERSIFRDLHALQILGLPFYFDRGYRLPSQAFLPPLHLTGEEALALSVAAERGADRDGPMDRALQSARSKLALRLAPATPVAEGQIPLAIPGVPTPSTEAADLLSTLNEAIATGRRVTIAYARSERSRLRSMEIVPRHLSLRDKGWLLVADAASSRRTLTIRLDQIRGATTSRRRGRRPREAGGSKPADAVGLGVRVRLKLRPPLSARAFGDALPTGLQIEERGGSVLYLASHAPGTRELMGWLLSFGPTIEVLEPVALRSELARIASELSAMYAAKG
jgi:predicted DNA-binding transcriptional regulator YafY